MTTGRTDQVKAFTAPETSLVKDLHAAHRRPEALAGSLACSAASGATMMLRAAVPTAYTEKLSPYTYFADATCQICSPAQRLPQGCTVVVMPQADLQQLAAQCKESESVIRESQTKCASRHESPRLSSEVIIALIVHPSICHHHHNGVGPKPWLTGISLQRAALCRLAVGLCMQGEAYATDAS